MTNHPNRSKLYAAAVETNKGLRADTDTRHFIGIVGRRGADGWVAAVRLHPSEAEHVFNSQSQALRAAKLLLPHIQTAVQPDGRFDWSRVDMKAAIADIGSKLSGL